MRVTEFANRLGTLHYGPYIGVPCSLLSGLITTAEKRGDYVSASSEGEAIGIAVGASLSGSIPVVLMQNSGLGNAVNPITSLVNLFEFPSLIIMGYRGYPQSKDEPQHIFMGEITEKLLKLLDVKYFILESDNCEEIIDQVKQYLKESGKLVAILIRKNILEDDVIADSNDNIYALSVKDALEYVIDCCNEDDIIVSTTGTISRILYEINNERDRRSKKTFYTLGSMGCASAIAHGLKYCKPNSRVIVLDGDGAALMNMGNLSTIGASGYDNFLHIILDNECYSSTGGQSTNSRSTRIEDVAIACGYKLAFKVESKVDLRFIKNALNQPELSMILVKTNNAIPKKLSRIRIKDIDTRSFLE